MNPNPNPYRISLDEKVYADLPPGLEITAQEREAILAALAHYRRIYEVRSRIVSLKSRNPYPNKRLRNEEIERLKAENNTLAEAYTEACMKFPFLPL